MLTTHVVSQDLAEELRASGWPQKRSVFSYFVFGNDEEEGMEQVSNYLEALL